MKNEEKEKLEEIPQQCQDVYGNIHELDKELARGGQGIVFKTKDSGVILKLGLSTEGKIDRELSKNESFHDLNLLPIPKNINLTTPKAVLKDYVGYIMSFLESMISFEKSFVATEKERKKIEDQKIQFLESVKDSKDFYDFILLYIATGGKRRRLEAYLKATIILAKLHTNGLVYCDISKNNIFISENREKCNVWLIDADNLNFEQETKKRGYYTPWYGAPEVIKNKGGTFNSDSYSILISLFYDLLNQHPFKGKALEGESFDSDGFIDEENGNEQKAINGELPWIRDREDDSNSSDIGVYEILVSSDLDELFDRMFCEEGRKKRDSRPRDFEIAYILAKELDKTIKCQSCHLEYIYNEDENTCPWCDYLENKIINIKSYELFNNKKVLIWEFHRELNKNTLEIPLRIIEDFYLDNVDRKLFCARIKENKLELFNFDTDYIFTEEKTGEKFFGSRAITEKKFNIVCSAKNKNSQKSNIIIEVEII